MEWTKGEVITMIELYRERPILWDSTRLEFKNFTSRNTAWHEIADEMRTNAAEVKAKMKTITTQYYRELKKVNSDSGAEYKTKWFAFDHLEFMRDKTTPPQFRKAEAIKCEKMEWRKGKVIRLIELYRERPILWDPTRPEFKNMIFKNTAWNEIANEMNINKAEVKLKMKIINTQFYRELKKVKRESGAEYKTKWFAFDHLEFMRDKPTPPPSRKSETIKEPANFSKREEIEVVTAQTSSKYSSPSADTTPSPHSSNAAASLTKRRSKKRRNPMAEEAYSVLHKLGDAIRTKDEFDVFGEHIACQLRKCTDLRDLATAKNKINGILFDVEIAQINRQQNQYTTDFISSDSVTIFNDHPDND